MTDKLTHLFDSFGGAAAGAAASVLGLMFVCIGLLFLVFFIIVWWKIWAKTGNSGFLGLLMFIPIVNFIMMLVLAFADWPVHKELRMLKAGQGKAV